MSLESSGGVRDNAQICRFANYQLPPMDSEFARLRMSPAATSRCNTRGTGLANTRAGLIEKRRELAGIIDELQRQIDQHQADLDAHGISSN